MPTIDQAIQIIHDAESRLRDLVGTAATEGEYDDVQRIAAWAQSLGILVRNGALPPAANARADCNAEGVQPSSPGLPQSGYPGLPLITTPQPQRGCAANHQDRPSPRTANQSAPRPAPLDAKGQGSGSRRSVRRPRRTSAESASRPSPPRRRQPPKGAYPKFYRLGDNLVKIGWSKKERKEYEHKAPRRVIDALAAAIARHGHNGRRFTTEQIMPIKDRETGDDLPGYQVYVALNWLKTEGLLDKHGRQGYTLARTSRMGRATNPATLPDTLATAWQKLPDPQDGQPSVHGVLEHR